MFGRNFALRRECNPALIILLVLSAIPFRITAQPNLYGISMLTHYDVEVTGSSGQNRSITCDGRGILYIGNEEQGILEYDGVRWHSIPVPGGPAILTLETGDDGVVYVGTEAGFGCLLPDRTGQMRYHSLSDSLISEFDPISGTVKPFSAGGKVYFCSPLAICKYDPASRAVNILRTPDRVSDFFTVDSILCLAGEEVGLMKLEGEGFIPLSGGAALGEMAVSGLLRIDRNRLLVATRSNGLLLWDTETGSLDESYVDPVIQRHLQEGIISQLRPLKKGFAVGTLRGGLLLFDREGNALQVIACEEGLPDPAITWIYTRQPEDENAPLWIVHGKGISKLEISTPFTMFTENSGYAGQINDIAIFSDRLFLATTKGLYYRSSSPLTTRFLPIPGLEGKHILQLHLFTPSRRGSLLLASSGENTWLIEPSLRIRTLKETLLSPDQDSIPSKDYTGGIVVRDPHRPNTLYTGQQQLVGLEYSRRGWSEVVRKDLPAEWSGKMEIDRYGFLWTTAGQQVTRMDLSRLTHVETRTYGAARGLPSGDRNLVFLDPGHRTLLLGTGEGFYRFDYFRNLFFRDTLLNPLLPGGNNLIRSFYSDPEGALWLSFRNEFNGWSDAVIRQQAGRGGEIREKLFRRLPDLPTGVFYGEPGKGVWLAKRATLYHVDHSVYRQDTIPFNVLIRKITLDRDSVLFRGAVCRPDQNGIFRLTCEQADNEVPKISYRHDSLTFEWAAPFFEAEDHIKFSVKMAGFDQQWSPWNKEVSKTYNDLASGAYTFHVRAMNVYGEISKAATCSFRIRRPWFGSFPAILIYILLAVGGAALMIRLRTRP